MIALASAQAPPEASFLIKVKYIRAVSPGDFPATCLAVFSDGRFHMERHEPLPTSKPQIFEDSFPAESLKPLLAILEAQDFKNLSAVDVDSHFLISDGEVLMARVPRDGTIQAFAYSSSHGNAAQPTKSLPAALEPLHQWIKTTTKTLDKQKLKPLKKAQAVNCWLDQK